MLNEHFTFVDLFAGIGGFRLALESLGGKCIGFSEINKQAIKTYKENFDCSDEEELGDITEIEELPECDVLTGGISCQPWSRAGQRKGFQDARGTLWFDTIRLIAQARPVVFILENVRGLIEPRNADCANLLIEELKALNYRVSVKLTNAYDFGLPQNRERVFFVGISCESEVKDFEFPEPVEKPDRLYKYFDNLQLKPENLIPKKFLMEDLYPGRAVPMSRNRFQEPNELNDFFILCDTRNGHTAVHSWEIYETTEEEKELCMLHLKNRRRKKYGARDGAALSLQEYRELNPDIKQETIDSLIVKRIFREKTPNYYEFQNSKTSSGIDSIYRVYFPESKIFSTLTATNTTDIIAIISVDKETPAQYKLNFIKEVIRAKQYRQITSREAARLQGFPEIYKLHKQTTTARRQLGNAVPVPVVYHIMKKIIKLFN